jgi:hypothetical protein
MMPLPDDAPIGGNDAMSFWTSDVAPISKHSRGDLRLSWATLYDIAKANPMTPIGWCAQFIKKYPGKVMTLRIERVDTLDGTEFSKGWLLSCIIREGWKHVKFRFQSPDGVPDQDTELKLLILL